MPYEAPIQRTDPTVLLFIVDQSGSMGDKLAASEKSKAHFVADVLNKTLADLIARCTKAESVRDYFEIGVIGYGAQGAQNGLQGVLSSNILNPISALEANPLRIESRIKKMDDGAGGIIEQKVNFPVWFEPMANGGTPMCDAIRKAGEELAAWCDSHPNSFPPTVLHVTDGESTDGDPEPLADALRQFATNDGNVLLLNLHVSAVPGNPISLPATDTGLPDKYAVSLYRMSSSLPAPLVEFAQHKGHKVTTESRGYMFNAEAEQISDFFAIGTRAAQLR